MTYSSANTFGLLAQGIRGRAKEFNCIHFFCRAQVPKGEKFNYVNFLVSYLPQQQEQEWIRLTASGNLLGTCIEYSAPTSDITTINIIPNIMISTPGPLFISMDIKSYYLGALFEDSKLPIYPYPHQFHLTGSHLPVQFD